MDIDAIDRSKWGKQSRRGKERSMRGKRYNPVFARHNTWTWRFVPGLVVGFLLKLWADSGFHRPAPALDRLPAQPAPPKTKATATSIPRPEEELKMVLVVNEELKMGKGKIAAQCAHASLAVYQRFAAERRVLFKQWERYCGQKKIALKVPTTDDLVKLEAAAQAMNIPFLHIQDAGLTQIAAGSKTVLAIGPWGSSQLSELTGHLKLL
ncbi:hypothetical protein WJX72_000512 [[Myrmecia] bisecta]|uniref:peptidyl-tRNA hydrolase n=1 Tax=[Myrmecia] bisecta TaxID=41462 RepID=A0AAW1PSA2_9CHLO